MQRRSFTKINLPGTRPAKGACVNHVWLVMAEGEPHECAHCGVRGNVTVAKSDCEKHTWRVYPGGARECLSCGKQEACPEDHREEEERNNGNEG